MDDSWKDEIVIFNPEDFDTYPSVCADPGEVRARFGFTGGEQFTHREMEAWFDSGLLPEACKPRKEKGHGNKDRDPAGPAVHAHAAGDVQRVQRRRRR